MDGPGKVAASVGISGFNHPIHIAPVKLHVTVYPWHEVEPLYLPNVCPYSSFPEQWSHSGLEILCALHGVLLEEFTVACISSHLADPGGSYKQENEGGRNLLNPGGVPWGLRSYCMCWLRAGGSQCLLLFSTGSSSLLWGCLVWGLRVMQGSASRQSDS